MTTTKRKPPTLAFNIIRAVAIITVTVAAGIGYAVYMEQYSEFAKFRKALGPKWKTIQSVVRQARKANGDDDSTHESKTSDRTEVATIDVLRREMELTKQFAAEAGVEPSFVDPNHPVLRRVKQQMDQEFGPAWISGGKWLPGPVITLRASEDGQLTLSSMFLSLESPRRPSNVDNIRTVIVHDFPTWESGPSYRFETSGRSVSTDRQVVAIHAVDLKTKAVIWKTTVDAEVPSAIRNPGGARFEVRDKVIVDLLNSIPVLPNGAAPKAESGKGHRFR